VELAAVSLTEWLDCFGRASGGALVPPALGRIIAKIQPSTLLGVLRAGGLAGAVGCGLAVRDGPLVGLFDLAVAPESRGRGYGTELIGRLVAWGFEHGATAAYLQVTRENARAASLYGRIGFRSAYAYHYRVQES
jgi:ribosomal protein S18 acetylase RimI-like enzyme